MFVKDEMLYQALYCGMCKSIKAGSGQLARTALTYDMAFMSALVHNLSGCDVQIKKLRCALHPFKRRYMALPDKTSVLLGCINTALAYHKLLDDRADGDELTRQLSSFVSAIFTQFDRYEIGNLITDVPFMGKTAYSTVYRGYKGDQVIRGTAIMASVGTKIYAFHFSCDADDYDAMTTVMEYLRSHVEANNG